MLKHRRFLIAILSLLLLAIPTAAQTKRPKIFISADMEGIGGVVNAEQLGPTGFEYAKFRQFMTAEVNAAIAGALEAGAGDILVADSHGNGLSVLPDEINPAARLIRSWPRPLAMMEGIDSSFDGVIFVGYHAAGGRETAVRAHTFSSARIATFKVNGQLTSEGMWNAAIAGHFGVPVILACGDNILTADLKIVLGNIETVTTKDAIGYHSANNLSPSKVRELIQQRAAAAVRRIKDFKPYRVSTPVKVEITYKDELLAELAAYLPIAQRTDAHTVAIESPDILQSSRILEFLSQWGSP